MQENFNPYREWLGFGDGREPANHYDLLEITREESDPQVISRAADILTARIRRVRPGPHVILWQQLLDAVSSAKACLLDPVARGRYDASLTAAAGLSVRAGDSADVALPPAPQPPAVETAVSQPRELPSRNGTQAVPYSPAAVAGRASNSPSPALDPGEPRFVSALPQRSGILKVLLRLTTVGVVCCGMVLVLLFLKGRHAENRPEEELPRDAVASHSSPVASPAPGKPAKHDGAAQTSVSKGVSVATAAKSTAETTGTSIAEKLPTSEETASPGAEKRPEAGGKGESKQPGAPTDPQKRQALEQALRTARRRWRHEISLRPGS